MKTLALSAAILVSVCGYAFADTAMEDLAAVYEDTAAFDGGPGSTINTSPAAADQS